VASLAGVFFGRRRLIRVVTRGAVNSTSAVSALAAGFPLRLMSHNHPTAEGEQRFSQRAQKKNKIHSS